MKWMQTRAARLVLPVAVLAFGIVGTGVTIANAGNTFIAANGRDVLNQRSGYVDGGMMGGFGSRGMMGGQARACSPQDVTGQLVRFRAMDSGRMMGGAMMRLMPGLSTVRAGNVTIELDNVGLSPHELLVYPLAAGARAGERVVLNVDRVSEVGSLGEVEPVCAQPAELDGIAAGNIARVTLTLAAGRYELLCNLPGHYRAGMWATLVVR